MILFDDINDVNLSGPQAPFQVDNISTGTDTVDKTKFLPLPFPTIRACAHLWLFECIIDNTIFYLP